MPEPGSPMSARSSLGPSGPLLRPGEVGLRPLARASIAIQRVDQRRVWLIVLIALIGGLAGRAITQSRAVVAGLGTLRPVAIATNDLVPGQQIMPDDLRFEQWPLALASAYPNNDEVVGAIVRSPIGEGVPLHRSQLFDSSGPMDATERAVTIPLPLAPPPVSTGDIVDLIGLAPGIAIGEQQLIETRSLGRGRVMSLDETGLTVAVGSTQVVAIIETMATGSVEVVITPFRS